MDEPIPVFGERLADKTYTLRPSSYAVVFAPLGCELRIVTVIGEGGYCFLPGGGIENGESEIKALKREILEETGYEAQIGARIGRAYQYAHGARGEKALYKDCVFYRAELSPAATAIIPEHDILVLPLDRFRTIAAHEAHVWAIEQAMKA